MSPPPRSPSGPSCCAARPPATPSASASDFEFASEAYRAALLHDDDERERVAARKAASAALSERINANLRDPPLVE